jgi:hypothetical protein
MHRATPALLRATRYAPRASRRQASSALFSGGFELPVVTQLKDTMRAPSDYAKWPVFRMIDLEGKRLPGTPEPSANLDEATCRKMMETMIRLNQMDTVLYAAQRQGRITFYCTHFGEEAASVASAAAYDDNDMIMSQYREAGALMYVAPSPPLHSLVRCERAARPPPPPPRSPRLGIAATRCTSSSTSAARTWTATRRAGRCPCTTARPRSTL